MIQSEQIYFADCAIDVAGFALRRDGAVCELEPQVLELLLYLVRNPDRLITKDDLIANVWHGRIVSDTTITSRIKSARKAIGDDAQETAARRFLEQALALDPDYQRAHSGFAVVLLCEWVRTNDPSADVLLERALEHAERAVAIDPDDYECQETLGWILLHCKQFDLSEQALPPLDRAQPQQPRGAGGDGRVLQLPGPAGGSDPVVRAGAPHRSLFRRELVLEPAGRLFQCAAL